MEYPIYVYTKINNIITWYEISKAVKKHMNRELLYSYHMKNVSDIFDDTFGFHPKKYLSPFVVKDPQLIQQLNNQIKN